MKYSDIKKRIITKFISDRTKINKFLKENDGSRIEAMHRQCGFLKIKIMKGSNLNILGKFILVDI